MSRHSNQPRATYTGFSIGGTWIKAEGSDAVTVQCSATGEDLGSFPAATEADIDRAVAAARQARTDPSGWPAWSADERALAMERLADAIERRGEEMAQLIAREVGTPIEVARGSSAQYAARLLRFYAGVARTLDLESSRPALAGHTIVRREPVGVVALIVPWNYPISLACFKLAPALASGSTAVLKPSPETGLDSYLLAEAVAEAGFPPGVINIVTTGGRRPNGLEQGLFVEPTVFVDVDPGMTIVREEIFGPVVVVLPYDGGDDGAVQLANESTYGLAGTVWSADPQRAIDVARRIDTGIVGINSWDLDIGAPFGGRRESGLGYELGPEGIDGYLRFKTLFVG